MKVEQDTLILDRIYMVKLSVLTGTSRIGNRHIMEAKTSHRSTEDQLLEVVFVLTPVGAQPIHNFFLDFSYPGLFNHWFHVTSLYITSLLSKHFPGGATSETG